MDSDFCTKTIDLLPYLCRCTLDIILETAMGRSLNIQNDKESRYASALQDMIHVIQQRQIVPWLEVDWMFNLSQLKKKYDESLEILHSFTKSIIKGKREALSQQKDSDESTKKGPTAFLDLLLSVKQPDGSLLDDADVQEEVDTFMFEGHDTTACALAWNLLLIGSHPEIQNQLYEEQLSIFGDDAEVDVTQEDISKMKYLEACIKEALRLYPSVPIIGRKLEEDCEIDGFKLPKGSTTVVFVYQLHRNPLVWENPNEYRPERFINQSGPRHPYAYVPFSAGPRNCIGQKFAMMEEKTVLSKLIRKFNFESTDTIESVNPVIEIITRPFNGVRSKITLRH